MRSPTPSPCRLAPQGLFFAHQRHATRHPLPHDGFDATLALRYRGRLDPYGTGEPPAQRQREMVDAMTLVARTDTGPQQQWPSIGCSIKWRH